MAGLFVDILGPNKDWLITLSQTMFTVAILLTPFVRDLTVLWLLFFTLGSAAGMANVCKYFSTVSYDVASGSEITPCNKFYNHYYCIKSCVAR